MSSLYQLVWILITIFQRHIYIKGIHVYYRFNYIYSKAAYHLSATENHLSATEKTRIVETLKDSALTIHLLPTFLNIVTYSTYIYEIQARRKITKSIFGKYRVFPQRRIIGNVISLFFAHFWIFDFLLSCFIKDKFWIVTFYMYKTCTVCSHLSLKQLTKNLLP